MILKVQNSEGKKNSKSTIKKPDKTPLMTLFCEGLTHWLIQFLGMEIVELLYFFFVHVWLQLSLMV